MSSRPVDPTRRRSGANRAVAWQDDWTALASPPQLRTPVLIAAFEGWDGRGGCGDGRRFLPVPSVGRALRGYRCRRVLRLHRPAPADPVDAILSCEIVWPLNQFFGATTPDGRDVVVLDRDRAASAMACVLRVRDLCAGSSAVQSVFTSAPCSPTSPTAAHPGAGIHG